ncbi:MAG TPA: hypothetical protein VGO27_07005, partial [Candidatus Acidoferrum sp.]|nr:hypothetical protein [Candidatus Acidoferrum sp.]
APNAQTPSTPTISTIFIADELPVTVGGGVPADDTAGMLPAGAAGCAACCDALAPHPGQNTLELFNAIPQLPQNAIASPP